MTTNNTKELPGNGTEKKPRSAALAVRDWMAQPTMNASLSAALGGYMTVETFAAQCYIAAQDPKLSACSAESLFKSFLECAQMGLLPGAHHKHVAMVPRNGVITVTPQWQGLVFLLTRQPGVRSVRPYLVHTTDEFEADRDTVRVHKFDPFNPARIFEHPETAKVFFRVLVSMRALQSKMNQRFEEFGKEVIQYYRAYLIALDEAFQGSVYEDALYILLKWQGVLDSQVSKHPTTVRGLVHVLKTWKLSATNEIEILGEIHRVLHDAITEAKKNAASLKAHHEDVSR
jgi:hypothetical protein